MSAAFDALCEGLQGVSIPYVIRRSRDVFEVDLAAMEGALEAPLPSEYRALLADEGLLYVTTPSAGDAQNNHADPRQHLVDGEIGADYWFSFLRPRESLSVTSTTREAIRDDFSAAALAERLRRAVIFQQGYGDFAFYVFVNEPPNGVSIYSLTNTQFVREKHDFLGHMREYARRWRANTRA